MNKSTMTKTELIDKAIDDLGGDISKARLYSRKGNIYLRYDDGYVLCHPNSLSYAEGNYFCTIQEFEQRKKEREMEKNGDNNHWYDYENQMAMKVPDQGTKCFVVLYNQKDNPTECEVVGFWNWKAILRVRSFSDTYYYTECDLKFIKPLDWDKLSKRKHVLAKAQEIFNETGYCKLYLEKLYDAGMLKLPEHK